MARIKLNFKKILKYALTGAIAFGVLFSIYTAAIYISWKSNEDEIINKLFSYKKQIDYIRTGSDDSIQGPSIGAVAIPTRVYDRKGLLIGEFFTERRTLIPKEKIPPYVIKSLIASEDRQFYEHWGINPRSIMRAMIKNLLTFRFAQGGSTITQQLAKVLFTNQEKTFGRKIYEFFCTLEIENRFTKEEILEMYLNLIYTGHGNYGIESASKYYYNKNARRLTIAEAAMIIGLLPNPGIYSPMANLDLSLMRQKTVLNALKTMGLLTDKQIDYEIKRFYKTWEVEKKDGAMVSIIGDFPDRAYRINRAPFFLSYIKSLLLTKFSPEVIAKGGLKVYTTLDYERQKIATETLAKGIEKQKEYYNKLIKKASAKKKDYYRAARDKTNGVFITVEPSSGHVLTMIGGTEFTTENQFNRAMNAYRQVGSLMKPFVYYLGLFNEYITPASMISDAPMKRGKFEYTNYDGKYMGDITVYEALQRSRNTPAVRMLEEVGYKKLRILMADLLHLSYAEIQERIPPELGVALGSAEFTPLEMAAAYAAFVNNGNSVVPKFILYVESQGKTLWEPGYEDSHTALNPDASFVLVNILRSVFKENGTASWVADVRIKNPELLQFQIAGKTGTTSNYKDAWFAGITSDEVSVVWIGSDYNASLGSGRSGGSLCSPVWVNYIARARRNSPPKEFASVYSLDDITYERFCTGSGGVAHDTFTCPYKVEQPFLAGSEPDYYCPLHDPKNPQNAGINTIEGAAPGQGSQTGQNGESPVVGENPDL